MEPTGKCALERADAIGARIIGESAYYSARAWVQLGKRDLVAWWSVGPAEIFSTRLMKRISRDNLLSNPYRHRAVVRTLPNGERIIFNDEEVDRVVHPPDNGVVRQYADYTPTWKAN